MHQLFEIMTLIQTKKMQKIPVLLYGSKFWGPLDQVIQENFVEKFKTINPDDDDLYKITDDLDEVVEVIKSSRAS